jgi:voltage-gated potassium channel
MVYDFVTAHVGLLADLTGLLAIVAVVIVATGVLIARFDRVPLEDAMYLAFITAFTVGFGDLSPRSRGARVVCVALAFLGLILVGILVAVAAHALDIALSSRAG